MATQTDKVLNRKADYCKQNLTPYTLFKFLSAEHLSPKKVKLSIMVGLYKPQKVKGYLPSY